MITPEQVKEKTPERFWSKIKFGELDECWEWQAVTNPQWGCGGFRWNRKMIAAHRHLMFELYPEIDKSLKVLHSCDNPPCCNPNHLKFGTDGDNARDRKSKGRGATCARHGRARLDDNKIREIRARLARGDLQKEIAKDYGMWPSAISGIHRGICWVDVK